MLILRTEGIFRSSWIVVCTLIIAAAIASSISVYIQVSNELTRHMEQRLLWEAKFYREQLNQVFLRAALRLDNLVHSPAAVSGNREMLISELNLLNQSSPSLFCSWVIYSDGNLIPAPNARPDQAKHLPWWSSYLAGKNPQAYMDMYMLGRSQAMVGAPFAGETKKTVLVPLVSLDLHSTQIVRAAGLLDLNRALTDNTGIDIDWSMEPVSVYTSQGRLVASPYHFSNGAFPVLEDHSNDPLMKQQAAHPEAMYGFQVMERDHQKTAGLYLREPSLGLILTVERPAAEVVDPVRKIAAGPLIIAAFCLLIATLLISTLYAGAQQLRKAEQLARSAEFRALQAHINPHFLFNTLNRMVGLAVSAGNLPLVEMIRSLSNIFRYTTRNPNALVSLREELNYLQEYVSLQQIRYGARFSFQLDVPDPLLDAQVFKFCIQPLVENCFVHGSEKSLDPVSISVSIEKVKDSIEISVSDDGPGISEERFKEVNLALAKEGYETGSQGHGVGLSNIHHRVRCIYGPLYGIILKPLEPGLTVCLRMPLAIFGQPGKNLYQA